MVESTCGEVSRCRATTLPASVAIPLRSSTSYAAITVSIGTPNSTGQRCAYRAPSTNDDAHLGNPGVRCRFCLGHSWANAPPDCLTTGQVWCQPWRGNSVLTRGPKKQGRSTDDSSSRVPQPRAVARSSPSSGRHARSSMLSALAPLSFSMTSTPAVVLVATPATRSGCAMW